MPNEILKYCEYCEQGYYAIRNSAKYCSDSCKTMACRARRAKEAQEAIIQEKQRAIVDAQRRTMDKIQASFDKMAAEQEALRNRMQQEAEARELQRKIENEKAESIKLEREKAEQVLQDEKRKQNAEVRKQLNAVLGLGIAGVAGFVSELMSKQPPKTEG